MTTTLTNWLEILKHAQFSYNLHQSSTMRMSPFEVAIGFQPSTPLDVLVYKQPGRSMNPTAYKFSKTQQDLLDEAQDSLERASRRMKKFVDK